MPNILGVLLCDSETEFSTIPILGKSCRDYVKAAMAAVGAYDKASSQKGSTDDDDVILYVADHTPCIKGLSTIVSRAADYAHPFSARSYALMTQQGSMLALAVPRPQLSELAYPPAMHRLLDIYWSAMEKIYIESEEDGIAVTDAESYAAAYRCLRERIVKKHMRTGVVVLEPERTVIEADVAIGAGTVVHPDNILQGHTKIGTGCTLYPGSRMMNAVIGDETTVEHSVLLDCSVGSHTTVGPFAYLRPQTAVGSHCRIGDFVEIKNSTIGDGTKVSHLTYVGDGDLGKQINLGCGVVFTNYDGKQKHRTVVEDNAFIGCNVNLIAPVHVGQDAYIAAGSTVTQDVPPDALFIARSEGVVKEGWVSRRKEKGKL